MNRAHHLDLPVAVGDVVSLQDRVSLMTVERLQDTPFGLTLDCCWFDKNRALRFGTFPARRLDLFPSHDWTGPARRGDIVRLKSRGPQMRVIRANGRGGSAIPLCEWTGPTGQVRQRHFSCQALTDAMEPVPFNAVDTDLAR